MAMKWFRKHNKKILVSLAVLLMLAFVGGRAIRDLFGGGPRFKDRPVAKAFDGDVMAGEGSRAGFELSLLASMGVPVKTANRLDYVLLIHEARQMGFAGGPETVPDEVAAEIARMNEVSGLEGLALKLQENFKRSGIRINERLLREVLGNYWAVVQAEQTALHRFRMVRGEDGRTLRDFRTTLGLAQPSEKQLELAFRNMREQIDVQYAAFPAWLYASKVDKASESDIIALFEAHKDEYPNNSDNRFGFGYKQRAQVRIEYLSVNLEQLKGGLIQPSPKELAEYYEQHKEQLYAVPVEVDVDEQAATDSQGEAQVEVVNTYKPLKDVLNDVRDRWLGDKGRAKALAMIAKARNISNQRWEELRKELKEGVIEPSALYPYGGSEPESLINLLTEEFEFRPEYRQSGWISEGQIYTLEGIGSSYTVSQPVLGFAAMVANVREPMSGTEAEESGQAFPEVGQDSRATIIDAEGNAYLFRVVELRRERIPLTSEMLADAELRARVAADVVRRRAYDYAKEQAEKVFKLCEKEGLTAALAKTGNKDREVRQSGLVVRADANLALPRLELPLVDERGKTRGQVILGWQNQGLVGTLPQPLGIVTVQVSNTSKEGRITAVALNLPSQLRIFCPVMRAAGSAEAAKNGGPAVSAGAEGYTVRYFGRGIEAGAMGRFDVLISFQEQQLSGTGNLAKGGVQPAEAELFMLQLVHADVPVRAADFARTLGLSPTDKTGMGAAVVARLETGGARGKSEILRAVFPANRRGEFLQECFAVLDTPGLQRRAAPKPEADQEKKEEKSAAEEASVEDGEQVQMAEDSDRTADLLIDSFTGQPPCSMLELPIEGVCYVMSVTKHLPLSLAEYHQSRAELINILTAQQYTLMDRQWWNSDSIRTRTRFEPIKEEQSE